MYLDPFSDESLRQINQKLGTNINSKYLKIAISTTPARIENPNRIEEDNQKLETLGDAVLKLIETEFLFHEVSNVKEITYYKQKIENNHIFAEIAHELGLKQHLFLGNAEKNSSGDAENTLLADAFEALIGALYLSCGLEESKKLINKFIIPKLPSLDPHTLKDKITEFHEKCKALYKKDPVWSSERLGGTDHDPLWGVTASLDGVVLAYGEGKSVKAAKLDACKKVLEK